MHMPNIILNMVISIASIYLGACGGLYRTQSGKYLLFMSGMSQDKKVA